jgi:DNA invertase Pin-like site-specific DNA recombinase
MRPWHHINANYHGQMPRVFSYDRVSSGQQLQGGGLRRQGDAAAAWATAHGVTLDPLTLRDGGRSAFHGHHLSRGALGRFLELAQAGGLGDGPILLVEAIDRLSRQEPLDAIETILGGLVGSGVRIITLEDGSEYSRDAIRADPARLLVLVVRIQAAHDYSARLSRRSTAAWRQAEGDLAAGRLRRPATLRPRWLDWDGERFEFNAHAEAIRQMVAMLSDRGLFAVARDLNDLGLLTATGRRWTAAGVRQAVGHPGIWGAARIRGELLPGAFPAIMARADWESLLLRIQARGWQGSRGRNGQVQWIGQSLTRCICGAAATTKATRSAGRMIRYLLCSDRGARFSCHRPALRLEVATAHLLIRLQPAQLAELIGRGGDRLSAIGAAVARCRELGGIATAAAAARAHTAAAVKAAARTGAGLALLIEAHQEAEADGAQAEQALAQAAAELQQLQASPQLEALAPEVAGLLEAFAIGSATAAQRQAVNRGLSRLGLLITIDGERSAMALAVGDGAPEWQPVRAEQLDALAQGLTGAETIVEPDGLVIVGTDEAMVWL